VSDDGAELWFASSRGGGGGLDALDIYFAAGGGGSFTNVAPATSLNSPFYDGFPTLSADQLTIYFNSNRLGSGDIFVAHRATASEPFGSPTPVAEVNSPRDDNPGWLSPDNCRLYFQSNRGADGKQHMYMAARAP